MNELIEYRVRPVTRYVVTRFHCEPCTIIGGDGEHHPTRQSGCSEMKGEFQNEESAYEVATSLADCERLQRGWDLNDMRIQYPPPPETSNPAAKD